jgi:hypothetical protein
MPSHAKPPKHLTTAREARASYWRRRGRTYAEIADQLAAEGLGRITKQGVYEALKRVDDRVNAEMIEEAVAEKVQQLGDLRAARALAFDQWYRSCEDVQIARQKTINAPVAAATGGANGAAVPPRLDRARQEEVLEVRGRLGDVAYLAEARAAMADVRKMLGLDAPTQIKADVTSDGKPVSSLVYHVYPPGLPFNPDGDEQPGGPAA